MTFRLVASDDALEILVGELLQVERYALDTEFHRERTYFPKLALIQLAWEGGLALVDPLRCDPRGLAPLFHSDRLAVLHAAQQDLDVLTHACGAVPGRLVDTQLFAGFLGYSTPSLVSLVHGELGIALAKGDRLTDWLARPLTDEQLVYAASDVEHLLVLYDGLRRQLDELGRASWAIDACEELRTRPLGPQPPEEAWLRIKDVRSLKPKSRGVAREVAAWRELRARRADVPVRQVLPDLGILGVAQQVPRTIEQLNRTRGLDTRHTRGAVADEILAAVVRGSGQSVDFPRDAGDDVDRQLRPAVTLVSAWIAERARQERIDTALLATRADLMALLRGDATARLRQGWRAELVGEGISRLLQGRAGLTFDPQGGLALFDVPMP